MARTQTLVQLTDDLLAQLDARAAREGRNRSDLIREALATYLASGREAEIDRLIVQGYSRVPQSPAEMSVAELATWTMLANAEPWEESFEPGPDKEDAA